MNLSRHSLSRGRPGHHLRDDDSRLAAGLGGKRRAALAVLIAAGATACGGGDGSAPNPGSNAAGSDAPGSEVVAQVGARPVTRKDFDAFLVSTLGSPAEMEAAGPEL